MTIFTSLQNQLQHTSHVEIAKQLQYNSLSTGLKTIVKFQQTKDIHSWLRNTHYDFKYTSVSFFRNLALIFKYTENEIQKILRIEKDYQSELERLSNKYIFVDTNFKRTTEAIFVLAVLEHKRRIKIDSRLLAFKNKTQVQQIISEMIQEHYGDSNGLLSVWGVNRVCIS